MLYSTNPFPEITSLVCDHGRQCQGACVRGIRGTPVAIPEIEHALSAYPWPYQAGKSNGQTIACIGAGPSNLTLAVFLATEGYHIEIYEKENQIGGAILTGIPSFRFDKSPLVKIREKMEALGIEFHFGVEVKPDEIPDLAKRYDYLVLGIGAEKENLAGQTLAPQVVGGLRLLRDVNVENKADEYKKYQHAYVWGGGNVALDCARTLKRLIPEVTILYRRGEKEMPGNAIEIAEAKEEGVKFHLLHNLKELCYDDGGSLKGGNIIAMELGEPDESGRASFHEIEGSLSFEPFDLFILAIGEKPDGAYLPNHDGGYLLHDNIYVSGDARYGAKNVAAAICDGRTLAKLLLDTTN